jgi:hypothetical protein
MSINGNQLLRAVAAACWMEFVSPIFFLLERNPIRRCIAFQIQVANLLWLHLVKPAVKELLLKSLRFDMLCWSRQWEKRNRGKYEAACCYILSC